MAKHDIKHSVSVLNIGTGAPSITFPTAAAAGDMVILVYGATPATFTPPAGFTVIFSVTDNMHWCAKIAGASEPTTYTAAISPDRNAGIYGCIVEGFFGSLSAVTLSAVQVGSGSPTTILSSPLSMAQDGLAIAFLTAPYGGFNPISVSSWSNSFTLRPDAGGAGAWIYPATRRYPSATSDVQTAATHSGGYNESYMMRISEGVVVPPAGNARRSQFYHNIGVR